MSAVHPLDALLTRGTVLRFPEDRLSDPARTGGTKVKFAVVLNLDDGDPQVCYALSTSRLDVYATGRWDKDLLRVAAGEYSFLPLETIFDLREVRTKEVTRLRPLFDSRALIVCGSLSADHMTEIDVKIRCSALIPMRLIKRIVKKAT